MISETLLSKLEDPSLIRDQVLIGGQWIGPEAAQKTFEVINPSNGETVAILPDLGPEAAKTAIDAAFAAQKEWASRSGKERAAVLRRLHDLIVANTKDLGIILTSEMGKPLPEAEGEVLYGAGYVEWFGEEAKRIYGDTLPGHQRDKRIIILKQPIGVVASITPWNFPSAMLTRKLAPALAAGCSLVAKPASETPLSAIALAILGERAGIPAGVFNLVTSTDSASIGIEFTGNPKVRKLTFTGSTNVGRILMRQGADQILKLSLELGGNAPFIVFDDADLDKAIEGAIVSKFRNNGQTCVCSNRIYVQSGIYETFAQRLADRVATLKVGDGFESDVNSGPLIDHKALRKVKEHVDDALSLGARIATGGKAHEKGGLFFEPTVLVDVTPSMLVASEETFGPVAPLFRFDTEDEVIQSANNTEFGLASYLFSQDINKIFRVAEALEYGMVGINTGLISTELAPFGGIKQSGLGREGSKYGIEDYLEIKYMCLSL